MRRKQTKEVPPALCMIRRELDQWRQRQGGRRRLPREFWAKAVDLARMHGVNRTARTLGLKYASLRQHLATRPGDASASPPRAPEFLELMPRALAAPSLTCTIELDDGHDVMLRMQVQGATLADLAAFVARLRGDRA